MLPSSYNDGELIVTSIYRDHSKDGWAETEKLQITRTTKKGASKSLAVKIFRSLSLEVNSLFDIHGTFRSGEKLKLIVEVSKRKFSQVKLEMTLGLSDRTKNWNSISIGIIVS